MYEVYGMPQTRSGRVVWALEELGADYRYHLVDLLKGAGQSDAFLKLNPYGKVPVLVDGDLVLTESAAICTYLGDQYPESELVPRPGTADRGLYDQWCYFVLSELEQPLWTITKHRYVLPPEKQVPQILDLAPWEFERASLVLTNGLGADEYLVGNSFSMADILVAHTLLWARALKLPLSPELDDYRQRISSRAAYQRARMREKAGNE